MYSSESRIISTACQPCPCISSGAHEAPEKHAAALPGGALECQRAGHREHAAPRVRQGDTPPSVICCDVFTPPMAGWIPWIRESHPANHSVHKRCTRKCLQIKNTRGSACALRCTPVYACPRVPLCTPVYPCVPLCTPLLRTIKTQNVLLLHSLILLIPKP